MRRCFFNLKNRSRHHSRHIIQDDEEKKDHWDESRINLLLNVNCERMNSSTNNPTSFSPYLLSRFHPHLNHLNDMAFVHTKILQEIIEKRSSQSLNSSPHGSVSSSSPTSSSSTAADSHQQEQQRKRSYPCHDDQHDMKNENKRSRKQSKPQQLVKITSHHHERSSPSPSSTSEHDNVDDDDNVENEDERDDEEEMGEINESMEKQKSLQIPTSPIFPFSSSNLPFFNYIQDLARVNHITSPISMERFAESLQKDLLSAAIESKQLTLPPPPPMPLPPGLFPQTVHHHHHHPYFSQILFNNSFINHFPSSPSSLPRFPLSSTDDHPFHFSTPKKRRTKVTDTRLSPRITTKLTSQSNFDDLTDEEISSVDDNPTKSDQPVSEYNGFQISILFRLDLR
ncbi:unnamed protein product [Adineta ricciae]|uniref:Uncharacterized protein n=2 Tax=Adineta ricciae TaxID=249248 RepID=A0A814MQ22_ADIRI|nr:unnamed protein product [Adineta ricciae]